MKVLALVVLFLSYGGFAGTENPRDTFQTFLKSMLQVKESGQGHDQAIATIDFSRLNALSDNAKYKISDDLIRVIDKIKKVDYQKIPTKLAGSYWVFDKRVRAGQTLEISLVKINDKWLFSPSTIESLDGYLAALANKKNVAGVKKLETLQDKIKAKLPPSLQGKIGPIQYWQLIGLGIILLFSFLIDRLAQVLIEFLVRRYSQMAQTGTSNKLEQAVHPLTKILFIFLCMKLIPYLNFSTGVILFIERTLLIIMSFMAIWFGQRLVELLSHYATLKAETTEAKFDDILIPLVTKTAFIVVYIIGALIVAHAFTIDVTGLIAGLGIGGLAFAFAAKDTLANFFGSIMLVLDRPFDIGDIITTGDISGVVTEVGFRSTRIRTFNDSLITISNGELMNRPIDNQGKRRFRRLNTTLGLEYDTPPAKIEAFCEGVRQLILNHPWTRKDSFHVYFENFAASSLDIKVIVYWETDNYARELAEKHRLNIDILRLANELEVAFAFPTQTVHMFSETTVNKVDIPEKYLEVGIEKAKNVAKKPLSLKNPRSNAEDEEQFGKNDIGL